MVVGAPSRMNRIAQNTHLFGGIWGELDIGHVQFVCLESRHGVYRVIVNWVVFYKKIICSDNNFNLKMF